MKWVKGIAAAGILAMTVVLLYAFTNGDFGRDGAALLANPWGIVSLVDLYTGFTLFSGWIVFRERSMMRSAVWILLVMVLGFWTASVYVFVAAANSDGDWERFWMGRSTGG